MEWLGWQCPVCFMVYSPHVNSCECSFKKKKVRDLGKVPLDKQVVEEGADAVQDKN
jgi:hypothetical protein